MVDRNSPVVVRYERKSFWSSGARVTGMAGTGAQASGMPNGSDGVRTRSAPVPWWVVVVATAVLGVGVVDQWNLPGVLGEVGDKRWARDRIAAGDARAAVPVLERLRRDHPAHMSLAIDLARAQLAAGSLDAALAVLDTIGPDRLSRFTRPQFEEIARRVRGLAPGGAVR